MCKGPYKFHRSCRSPGFTMGFWLRNQMLRHFFSNCRALLLVAWSTERSLTRLHCLQLPFLVCITGGLLTEHYFKTASIRKQIENSSKITPTCLRKNKKPLKRTQKRAWSGPRDPSKQKTPKVTLKSTQRLPKITPKSTKNINKHFGLPFLTSNNQ